MIDSVHMRKREYSCVCCKKRTNQRDRRRVTAAQRLVLQKWTVGDVSEDEVLCSLCRVKENEDMRNTLRRGRKILNLLPTLTGHPLLICSSP
uniref:Uncharacterized protein n=1 Tax=Magallana gigas TaxID=29159 RepID=A0A8W8M751_MAGGI